MPRQYDFLVQQRRRKVAEVLGNGYYSHAFTRAARYRGRKRMAVIAFREYIIKIETLVKSTECDGIRGMESLHRCSVARPLRQAERKAASI